MAFETRSCMQCGKDVTRQRCAFRDKVFCNNFCRHQHRRDNPVRKRERKPWKKIVNVNCSICDKEFSIDKNRTYKLEKYLCSDECKKKYYERFYITLDCEFCGNIIKRKKTSLKPRTFCNPECAYKYFSKINNVTLNCSNCSKEIKKIKSEFENNKNGFCDRKCYMDYKRKIGQTIVTCNDCGKEFSKKIRDAKLANGINFCGKICANKNLKHNKGVSKVEIYIQSKLLEIYPYLDFDFNMRNTIGSQLDIFIFSLKLAFELNGPLHYEPIYGQEKLDYIQNNDNRKFQACLENGIEFVTINISQIKYVKPDRIDPYLQMIVEIINSKIERMKIMSDFEFPAKRLCSDLL